MNSSRWILPLLFVLACGDGDDEAPDFAGVWTVDMRYAEGSCPDVSAGTRAAVWTVNTDSAGAFAVAVQGDEEMPKLRGKKDGRDVVITGLASGFPASSTVWRLHGGGDKLSGRAIQTRTAKDAFETVGRKGDVVSTDATCAVIWEVGAKRQGGK